ncbi:hypothetical protein [Pirellulimonas nuda]|nr:hypothetical protein [Pirellulimonas nuda]
MRATSAAHVRDSPTDPNVDAMAEALELVPEELRQVAAETALRVLQAYQR